MNTCMIGKNLLKHCYLKKITHADYGHTKRVYKDFEIKKLGEYHDLHVQSDTLLLADISENFRNMCLGRYELDSVKLFSVPGLAWQEAF